MKAIYKSVKLLWQANIDEAEQRFIVEIAHLLGFKSTNMIFPILTEKGGEQNTLYFVVGKDRGECLYDGKYRIEKKDNLMGKMAMCCLKKNTRLPITKDRI